MNEKLIEQLASQAGMLRDKYGLYWNAHDNPDDGVDLEKFTEVIVRECAGIIQKEVSMKFKDGGETEEFMGGHFAASVLSRVLIKQHFGVEDEKSSL